MGIRRSHDRGRAHCQSRQLSNVGDVRALAGVTALTVLFHVAGRAPVVDAFVLQEVPRPPLSATAEALRYIETGREGPRDGARRSAANCVTDRTTRRGP